MDSTLSHALIVLVMSLVTGVALFTVSHLTAESELFYPVREWLLALARKRFSTFLSRLYYLSGCAFCTSWWHAMWLVPVSTWAVGGDCRLAVILYFSSIGVAACVARLRARPADTKPRTLQEMAKGIK